MFMMKIDDDKDDDDGDDVSKNASYILVFVT